MRDIRIVDMPKYASPDYIRIRPNIYKQGDSYVTTLQFAQEPLYGEGSSPVSISQYPLEDILDRFFVYVSDFYEALNSTSQDICTLEFASMSLDNILRLQTIAGKHVYYKINNLDDQPCNILTIE